MYVFPIQISSLEKSSRGLEWILAIYLNGAGVNAVINAGLLSGGNNETNVKTATLLHVHVLRTYTKAGENAFQACAPRLWNELSCFIRLSPSLAVFR